MSAQSAALRILLDGDFRAMRRHWSDVFPHLPGPQDDGQAEIALHMARTQSQAVPLKQRAWSHYWLLERHLPSQLPDDLKPKAERMYPRVAAAVGIAVRSKRPEVREIIRNAMENAVLEAEAEGRLEDSDFVKERIHEARRHTVRELFGSIALRPMKGKRT